MGPTPWGARGGGLARSAPPPGPNPGAGRGRGRAPDRARVGSSGPARRSPDRPGAPTSTREDLWSLRPSLRRGWRSYVLGGEGGGTWGWGGGSRLGPASPSRSLAVGRSVARPPPVLTSHEEVRGARLSVCLFRAVPDPRAVGRSRTARGPRRSSPSLWVSVGLRLSVCECRVCTCPSVLCVPRVLRSPRGSGPFAAASPSAPLSDPVRVCGPDGLPTHPRGLGNLSTFLTPAGVLSASFNSDHQCFFVRVPVSMSLSECVCVSGVGWRGSGPRGERRGWAGGRREVVG